MRIPLHYLHHLTRWWRPVRLLRYDWFMGRYRTLINLAIWAAAAAFAAFRVGTGATFMLGVIEGLMVLIAAFVAQKTLDLLIPPARNNDEGRS